MHVLDAIKTRRSVRAFRPEPIPDDLLTKVLEAGTWAPSAGNLQPWEFIVVKSQEMKVKIARAALHQMWITEAPVVVVACANEKRSEMGYGERGRAFYCICDVSAAVQNMLLAIHALGLASCWIGAFDDYELSEVLKLPPGVRPIAILPIGYGREAPRSPPRRPLSSVIHLEHY
ncbi:MAG: nitroreductase family protein [Thermoprotei archaeon]|nr:MAG: nitroreductase family protein [Thermoprotei archaeon]RLF18651.1 MAG: nitroreductase family protein [Thermoprotei archaeon]